VYHHQDREKQSQRTAFQKPEDNYRTAGHPRGNKTGCYLREAAQEVNRASRDDLRSLELAEEAESKGEG
jgi:hypothetical protein